MTTTWWFGITDIDSELCGEEFFVEVDTASTPPSCLKKEAQRLANLYFPNEKPVCYGQISATEAEMMGLDTY